MHAIGRAGLRQPVDQHALEGAGMIVLPQEAGDFGTVLRQDFGEVRVADDMAGGVGDRKSGVEGKSVSVRVDLGGRRIIQKKQTYIASVTLVYKTINDKR